MSRPFYPFVENDGAQQGEMQVTYPARIAVYDDAAAAPRVVVIDPKEPRAFLEEITATVVRLSKEQGGSIPFMVIREVVENFIHAYFIQPTISILDGGETIRFSDQGPGIKEKDRALEYGTSSATEEMKKYIRGVGSGLPYAQQYMVDKGGSLTIEDNISGGTIVTISALPSEEEPEPLGGYGIPGQAASHAQQPYGTGISPYSGYQQPYPVGGQQYPGYPQQVAAYPPYPQAQQPWGYQQPAYASPYNQQGGYGQQAPYGQAPWTGAPAGGEAASMPQGAPTPAGAPVPPTPLVLSERGRQVLLYLAQHDAVGPTELTRAFGSSNATWSRELVTLESAGLIRKPRGEQKRTLTDAGRAFIATL